MLTPQIHDPISIAGRGGPTPDPNPIPCTLYLKVDPQTGESHKETSIFVENLEFRVENHRKSQKKVDFQGPIFGRTLARIGRKSQKKVDFQVPTSGNGRNSGFRGRNSGFPGSNS